MKIKNINIISVFLSILLLFTSCSMQTLATIKADADNDIRTYMLQNKINATPNQSGLVFISLKEGNGDTPQIGDKVAFHYTGYYFDGKVFDSSYDRSLPLVVQLGNNMIIKGMEEALLMMNKGSKAKIIVPFYLAYNDMENVPVPPYSNLIFEIELIDFTK